MYSRIYTLLEILNIILCLHFLYGKKIRVNIGTVLIICADALVFEVIARYETQSMVYVLMYALIFAYTVSEFGIHIREAVLSNILYFVILGIIELFVNLPLVLLRVDMFPDGLIGLYVNIATMGILCLLKSVLYNIFNFVIKRNVIATITTISFGLILVYMMLQSKTVLRISLEDFLIILIFGILIFILSYCWQIEREKVREKEMELQMHNLYDASFKEMIMTIQEKQHDFHNHIQAIQCQHYTIHTYEELVAEQEEYCEMIIDDNKFYRLLNYNAPVLTGFLYGEFIKADKKGIEIEYSVKVKESISELPEYIFIEIMGILLDNAVEAVKDQERKVIVLNLEKTEKALTLEVGNPAEGISYAQLQHFFERGYSNKKDHSGIGLSKIFKYSEKYGFDLIVDKREKEEKEWLFFRIGFGSCSH